MNRGILNIEVVDRGHGSCLLNIYKLKISVPDLAKTYLSLERDRFQFAVNQREEIAGLGVNAFQAKSSNNNQKS